MVDVVKVVFFSAQLSLQIYYLIAQSLQEEVEEALKVEAWLHQHIGSLNICHHRYSRINICTCMSYDRTLGFSQPKIYS